MALSCKYNTLKVQRLGKILAKKAAQRVPDMPSYGNFGMVTKNPHFSEKVQRGDQRKFFKNRPSIRACLKRLKTLWRKWHYPSISMLLTCKDWRRFWRIRRLQKCPNGQVMAIFARSPKPAFSEKVQRGDQGKFFKNRPKGRPRLKNP